MKITDVKSFPVWAGIRNLFVLKVETDAGHHGWGESGVSGRELAVQGAVAHFREFLIGKDPRRIGALWQEMYRGQYFEGGRVLTGAISAIDIALHDVVAKSLGVPVYQLLGGAQRDSVPCFVTSGAPMGPEAVDDALRYVEQGWPAVRFIPGHPETGEEGLFEPRESIAHTAEWLVRAREKVGPAPVLGHRLPPPSQRRGGRLLLPDAAARHARLPGGADQRRNAGRLPDPSLDDRRSIRHRRGAPQQVGLPAVRRAGHHQLCTRRHMQRRRLHRGHEGGGLVRGALHRPDAAQPPGADQHRGQRPSRRGRAQLRPGSRTAPRSSPSTPTCSPCSTGWTASATPCRRPPASASSSTRRWRASRSASGKLPDFTAAMAPTRTGSPVAPSPTAGECRGEGEQ